jgi:hypothetical protein
MPRSHDPALLSPEERFHELARLLAAGLLRLRRPLPSAAGGPGPRFPQNSAANGLELPGEMRLSVPGG